MNAHIKIRNAGGTWVVRAGGAILAESKNALEMTEGDYPPVIYFPREDVGMEFLDRSETTSHCPHKGDANYYGIQAKSGLIANAAWSYEDPFEGMETIKEYLAFYTNKATIEQL